MTRTTSFRAALLLAAALGAGALAAQAPGGPPRAVPADPWRTFEGTWAATGQRQTLPAASGGQAATVQLSGTVAVAYGEGLSRGFRGEVVGFDDGAGSTVAHAVWTDERGDRIFSRLRGDTLAAGRRVTGTFTGGTGRYTGIDGDFAFEWQYVVADEAGAVSGRVVGLRGRYRAIGGVR